MTWAEFVVSEYNTSDEFLVDNLNFNYTAGYGLIDSQGYGQSLSTTIKANEAYDTEYIGYRV